MPFLLALAIAAAAPAALAQPSAPAPAPAEVEPWTVEALVAAAQASDPRLVAAAAEASRQRAAEAEARAGRWPSLDYLLFAGPAPELRNDPDRLDQVPEASRLRNLDPGGVGLQTHLGATLTWPIWRAGRGAAEEVAARTAAAASGAAQEARARAGRDAVDVYWTWAQARRNVAALEDVDRQLAGARERLDKLVAGGSSNATRQDVAQLDLARAELASRRAEAAAARDLALEAARAVAGVPPDAPFALAPAGLEPPAVQPGPLARYVETALAHRPEVVAAGEALRARQAAAEARQKERWPELVGLAFLDLNWTSSATPQTNPFAYDPYNRLWGGLGLALRGRLEPWSFEPGRAQAEADVDRARAAAEASARATRLEVARAHGALRAALERSVRMRDEEAAAKRWLNAAELAFDAGHASAQAVLLAALANARAGAERAAAVRDAHVAAADLALAVGEEPRPPPP